MSRSSIFVVAVLFVIPGIFSGCGVKGKPLPPLEPAEIGRGSPTYKRAAEQAKPSMVPGLPEAKPSPQPSRSGR